MKKVFYLLLIVLFTLSCKEYKIINNISNSHKNNVLFILVDDLGYKDLGCYGSEFYETPNLDRLASEGVMFTNAYTPNPVCSPTRASIMTGKYPSRVRITDWIKGYKAKDPKLKTPDINYNLPLGEVTLGEMFKENGYKTFFAGKWHLGDEGYYPENQGFDINLGGAQYGSPPGGYYSPYKNTKLVDGPDGEYLPDRLASETIKFFSENKEKPFLAYLSFYSVHRPIEADKKSIEKFKKKKNALTDSDPHIVKEHQSYTRTVQSDDEYASMVYAMDRNVGRVLKALDSLNLTDNTTIIFTSDNGGLSTSRGTNPAPTSVYPYRAGKGWVYEGGLKVPMIIKSPSNKNSRKIDEPVISMDLFTTLIDLNNLKYPDRPKVDGHSLKPILIGNDSDFNKHETLLYHYPHYHGSGWKPGTALRYKDWKIIHFYEDDTFELYNIKDDIQEENDLSKSNPQQLEKLKEILAKTLQETDSPIPERIK